jgi:hypothetical protein
MQCDDAPASNRPRGSHRGRMRRSLRDEEGRSDGRRRAEGGRGRRRRRGSQAGRPREWPRRGNCRTASTGPCSTTGAPATPAAGSAATRRGGRCSGAGAAARIAGVGRSASPTASLANPSVRNRDLLRDQSGTQCHVRSGRNRQVGFVSGVPAQFFLHRRTGTS